MADSSTNRSLERGILLLKLINRLGGVTLSQLAREADLPKSTVRRLLLTLLDQRLIRKSLADGLYRCNIFLPLEKDYQLPPHVWRLCDVATPVMLRLVDEVRWPSDLFVREGIGMRYIESTRTSTPISLYPSRLNIKVKMLYSAGGRTYLAYCPEAERRELIETIRKEQPCDITDEGIDRMIEQIRQQGYGTRQPGYTGETKPDDGLSVIAVPVLNGSQLLGCISLICVRDYMTEARFAERHLAALQSAAQEIGERYGQGGNEP
ncbi:IclR family transcriptional regulator domain-containing protein [Marinobacterium lutimaris]|uniref:Transcriptional regulator, IclR family n=1 Tax=Marinobacterium lutimaris TaxID=568106 RepID=A0A1H5Y4E4_9GAMM|nr:helix-turn-helix domain-containing protein [Marinobacterium lutimaris]SEG18929.1 transcriptional regulator, IclR family [Marinobacterium lutimaris]